MEIYQFFWSFLAWSVSVAVLWPVVIPWAVVAFRINTGTKGVSEVQREELWMRSTLGTGAIAVGAIVLVFLNYLVVANTEYPPGPIHVVTYLAFLAYAVWMLMLFLEFEDFFAGLSMFVIYLYLPITVLWIANKIYPFWSPILNFVLSWLKEPK